ncbi:hypothetical protein [Rhodococcoides yunnanense]|uniref:antitoxin VbhA family protein n=1 Tax=Rhodococcoides yunnanense TaxID=278209 RepID=UPI000B00C1ED
MDQSGLGTTLVGELGSLAEGIRNFPWFCQRVLILGDCDRVGGVVRFLWGSGDVGLALRRRTGDRARAIDAARTSSALEGGRSTDATRVDQEADVRGEIDIAGLGSRGVVGTTFSGEA